MAVYTYDPSQVAVIVGGIIISGYADGTFVTLGRKADMWALKMGTDGRGTRAKSNDKSGMMALTLQQSAESNDDLSALAAADERANAGVVPLLVRDASGRTIASALSLWLPRYANIDLSKEVTDRTWNFETDNLDLFVGGN